MKEKITIVLNGKSFSGEREIRNPIHFNTQLMCKAHTFRDKSKYNRKIKYKKVYD